MVCMVGGVEVALAGKVAQLARGRWAGSGCRGSISLLRLSGSSWLARAGFAGRGLLAERLGKSACSRPESQRRASHRSETVCVDRRVFESW